VGWAVYVCEYMYVYAYVYVYIYIYIYANAYICIYVDAWVCVCVYIYICVCMRVLVYIYMRKVYVYMCVNIYMRVYAYMFACTCMGRYVRVCVWTHVNVCEGPYHPLRFGRRGCCSYKSESTESDWYTASPYGLVDLQLPHSSDRGYHVPLSVSVTVVCLYKWYSHAPQPCAPTVDYQPSTNNKDANLTSLLSVLH